MSATGWYSSRRPKPRGNTARGPRRWAILRCATRRGATELNHDDPSSFSPPAAFGPFRVLHQIGSGVLGPVFRTYEPERDRLIAVKAFRIDLLPEQSALLATELQGIVDAGLTHPGIVLPVASGMEGHLPYLAQEYVAAESLDIAMKHYAPAVPARVMPFLTAIAGALDAAAASGVLHGALHPRDVFVTTDEARATGFGIVQAIENIGFRAPTRRPYTAPERVSGEEWGTEADIFSLAAIAHELLTGRRPAGPGDQDGSFASDVPAEHRARIREVFARALAEDPAARFESATAFVDALQAASEGQQVAPAPAARASRTGNAAAVSAAAAGPSLFDDDDAAGDDDVVADEDGADGADDEDDEGAVDDADDVETIDDVEDESDIEDVTDVEDTTDVEDVNDDPDEKDENDELDSTGPAEPAERSEPEEPDAWPPAGFRTDDADVIAERETDAALGDFDLDLNRDADRHDAALAPAALEYDTSTEDDEDAPHEFARDDSDAPTHDDRVVPSPPPPAVVPPPREVPAWRAAPPPDAGGSGLLRPVLWVLSGVVIGFFAAWLWLGGNRAASGAVVEPAAPAPSAAVTEEPVAPAPRPVPPASGAAVPAPPAPAAGAPTAGRLVVRSTPSNAMVVIDGVWSGRTPFTREDLAFGRHTVRVVLEGHEPVNRTITLSPESATSEMTLTLARAARGPAAAAGASTGTLTVSSRPIGARVFVDGRSVGTTPLKLPGVALGSRRVRVELAGHRPWASTVTVGRNQEARVAASLQRQ